MTTVFHWLALIKGDAAVWAQAVHFLLGYGALLTCYREGVRRRFWMIGLFIFLGAFGIEVWYDPKYEHDPFLWGGVRDLAFYGLGAATGIVVDYL